MELLQIAVLLAVVAAINAGTNVALNKPTNMSSQYTHDVNALSGRAVDGNLNQNHDPGQFCFHTGHESANWWYVDLQNRYSIQKVTLYNRLDYGPYRARNIKILVGDSLDCMEQVASFEKLGSKEDFIMPENTYGRYVKLLQEVTGGEWFHLCEIQVFSDDC